MTPGTENERGGEGARSSKHVSKRRAPKGSPNQAKTKRPAESRVGATPTPDRPARRGGTRGQPASKTSPAVPPPPVEHRVGQESDTRPDEVASTATPGRQGRDARRGPHSNALGTLIEAAFADPNTPVHSYSELERRSRISREALSRYVTPRPDRRRSPTIETLATIADAMHLSLEQVCRAAAASSRGAVLPSSAEQRVRDEVVAPLLAALTEQQFAAVIELLRQMQPRPQAEP